LVILMY